MSRYLIKLVCLLLLPVSVLADYNATSTTIQISVNLTVERELEPQAQECIFNESSSSVSCESDLVRVDTLEQNGQQIVILTPI